MAEAEVARTKVATKGKYVSYEVNSSYLAYLYKQLLLSDTVAVPVVAAATVHEGGGGREASSHRRQNGGSGTR